MARNHYQTKSISKIFKHWHTIIFDSVRERIVHELLYSVNSKTCGISYPRSYDPPEVSDTMMATDFSKYSQGFVKKNHYKNNKGQSLGLHRSSHDHYAKINCTNNYDRKNYYNDDTRCVSRRTTQKNFEEYSQ